MTRYILGISIKKILRLFALSIGCANTFGLALTTILAYNNGYKLLIVINRYGEGLLEVILLPLSFVLITIALVIDIRDIKKVDE